MTAWTTDRIDQLKALHAEKKSSGQIARIMGTTRNSICGVVRRLGLMSYNGGGIVVKGSYPAERKPKRIPPAPIQEVTVLTDEPEFIGPVADFPDRGKCKYIQGDPATTEWRCCGWDAINGGPYCGRHDLICRPVAAKKAA